MPLEIKSLIVLRVIKNSLKTKIFRLEADQLPVIYINDITRRSI